MIQITCINKASGDHENPFIAISFLGWRNTSTNNTGKSTRLEMYEFVLNNPKSTYVSDNYGNTAYLVARISANGTKYVKTEADSTTSDNLLKLPECRF